MESEWGMSKILIAVGVVCILAGISLPWLSRIPGLGRFPGDIFIKKENFTFYFPLTTCLLLSALLSFILFLWRRR